jgi:hypothetical protein
VPEVPRSEVYGTTGQGAEGLKSRSLLGLRPSS